MADLTSISSLLKKIATATVVIGLIVLLVFLIFLRFKKTEPEQPIQTKPIKAPTISQDPRQKQPFSFDLSKLQEKEFPESLAVYFKALGKNFSPEEAQAVASALGVNNSPFLIEETIDGKQYNWEQAGLTLTLSGPNLRYKNTNEDNSLNSLLEQDLINSAISFLEKLPVASKNLSINPQKTTYLKSTTGLPVSTSSITDADLIDLHLGKKLEGYPLLTNNPSASTAVVRIRKNGQITSLNLKILDEPTKSDNYKLKNSKEAIDAIKRGQGKVVQTLLLDENNQALELFRLGPQDIKDVTIENLSLAYFLPDDPEQSIQPVYVFQSISKKNNQKIKVFVYLPAIKNLTQP